MSDHHCWYVTGRALRLALAYALFASISVVNPAFAVEASEQTAQQTVISNDLVTPTSIADTLLGYLGSEQDNSTHYDEVLVSSNTYSRPSVDDDAAEALSLILPEAGGEYLLPKTGEVFETVIALERDRATLIPAIIAYERDGTYFIPINELAKNLKFPSTFDKNSQRVQGQYFGGEKIFVIDAQNQTYQSFGETHPLPSDSFLTTFEGAQLGDIYITAEIIDKIWPLDFKFSNSRLSLVINSDRKLPYELEREREIRRKELELRRRRELEPLDKNYIFQPNGYPLLGPHRLRLGQNFTWNNESKNFNKTLSISGDGDLLGTEAFYGLSVSQTGGAATRLQDVRMLLRREDSGDGKLLPFGLTTVEAGDVNLPTSKLGSNGLGGTGIKIRSGRKAARSNNFNDITVEGTASPGWEVEIYNNRILLDFGAVDELGEYRFENIPINFGQNKIRIVLYGPEGQIEERIEEYEIGRKFLKPGEITYEAGAVFSGNKFIDIRDTNNPNAQLSKSLRVDTGINEFMSGFATFVDDRKIRGREGKFISVGTDFEAFEGVGRAEAFKKIDSGTALDLSFGREFFTVNTTLSAKLFNDFESFSAGFGEFKKSSQYDINLSRQVETKIGRLGLNTSAQLNRFEGGRASELNFSTGQNLGTEYGSFSHNLNSDYEDGEIQQRQGSFSYGKTISDNFSVSSGLRYELEPLSRFTGTSIDLRYRDKDLFTAFLGFSQSLEDSSDRALDLGASYKFDKFNLNFGLDWDHLDGTNVRLGTTTSLGPDPETGKYQLARSPEQLRPAFTARLFQDLDGDGVFSDGDKPIPNTALSMNGKRATPKSDENGFIEVNRAQQGFVALTVFRDRGGIYNPFLIPAYKDGIATVLRRGTKPHIEYPLIMSGNIDGTLNDANDFGLNNYTIQLIDQHGQLFKEAKTTSGGFYSFEFVRPGRYIVQVSPVHRIFVPPKTVTISSEDLFAYGVDLRVLEQVPTDESAAVEAERDGRVAHTYHDASVAGGEDENPAQPFASAYGEATPADDGVQSIISAVRVGEYPNRTRLVLDLSGPISYSLTKDANDANVLYLEIPNSFIETEKPQWKAGKHSLFSSIDFYKWPNKTHIRLETKAPLRITEDAFLPAKDGLADRIFIDFTKVK